MNASKTSDENDRDGESVTESWEQLGKDLERLREDLNAINESVADLSRAGMSEGRDRVAAQLDELARRTTQLGNDLNSRGRQAAHQAGEKAGAMTRDLEEAINRNPITAMLIAMGLGFLIGMSSRGRH